MSKEAASPDPLTGALADAQRIGLIGPGPLEPAIEQARRFVNAVPDASRLVIDLGSGGGLPGLVLAHGLPGEAHVVLVDRRERSTDFLRRAVSALGLGARTTVVAADATELGHDPRWRGQQHDEHSSQPHRGLLDDARVRIATTRPAGQG